MSNSLRPTIVVNPLPGHEQHYKKALRALVSAYDEIITNIRDQSPENVTQYQGLFFAKSLVKKYPDLAYLSYDITVPEGEKVPDDIRMDYSIN